MFRHYLPSIAAVIALGLAMVLVPIGGKLTFDGAQNYKASSVSAQAPNVVLFELELFEPTVKTVKLLEPIMEFPRPARIQTIYAVYCCFLGEIKLYLEDILVHQQDKPLHHCDRCSNDYEAVDWVIPQGIIADKVEQPGIKGEGEIKYIDILGGRTDTVSVNDLAKSIDRVSNLASTTGVQKVSVSSKNPEVIVWLGRPDDYLKKETTVFTDTVYACADLNVNNQCDFLNLACNDKSDNDGDGKTDFPNDPGCDSLTDNDETDAPACQDGLDNDNDGLVDFPHDPGCTAANDTNETDPPPPPIDKIINLTKSSQPKIIILPLLAERELLKFQTTCGTCTIQTSQDPLNFLGGSDAADGGFKIIASLLDSATNTYSHTIVAVGQYEQHNQLFNRTGQEYLGLGENTSNQYRIGVLANAENEIYFRTRINNQFEQIKMTPTHLPLSSVASLSNGSTQDYLFSGEDRNGKEYLVLAKGRHWDMATITNSGLTPEPFLSFFQGKGTLAQCAQTFQNYPAKESMISSTHNFQLLLELFSLCQR
jgi:hypothetical protein